MKNGFLIYLLIGGVAYWYFFMRGKNGECPPCDVDKMVEDYKSKFFRYQKEDWKKLGEEARNKAEKELITLEEKIAKAGIKIQDLHTQIGIPSPNKEEKETSDLPQQNLEP